MRAEGLLPASYELVNGEVIAQMGQNMPHASVVTEIVDCLIQACGKRFVVTQASIDVAPEDNPTSEPAPDVIVLTRPKSEIITRPVPRDIRLLVEVSDTTLSYDLDEKGPLYARAGIGEYWVADVNRRELHRHTEPRGGFYSRVVVLAASDRLSLPSGAETTVDTLFGR